MQSPNKRGPSHLAITIILLTGILCLWYFIAYGTHILEDVGLLQNQQLTESSSQNMFIYHNATRPTFAEKSNIVKYITSCGFRGKLGNHMFEYASMKGMANLANRVAYLKQVPQPLGGAFRGLNVQTGLAKSHSDISTFNEIRHDIPASIQSLKNRQEEEICVCCYLQSPLYFQNIKQSIREEYSFHDDIVAEASTFLKDVEPKDWAGKRFTRVGIHVRRRELLKYNNGIKKGFHFPPPSYFEKAVDMFTKQYPRVQFIVASDEIDWCQKFFKSWNATFAYSTNRRPAVDMSILSQCDHVILTMGTFSWWIGWLNRGTTVYYEGFRLNGSKIASIWRNEQYIPQPDVFNKWIGLTD